MSLFRNVGRHAQDLEGGRMLEPGGTAILSKKAQGLPHNKRLIAEGLLIPATEAAERDAEELLSEEHESDNNDQKEEG